MFEFIAGNFLWIIAVIAIAVFATNCLRIVGQFERGVVLTLGKFSHVAEPGLTILLPLLQTMTKVDVRITATNINPQDVITSDNVSVKVDAITYYQVTDARKALLDLRDYAGAISQLAQITLRSTIGQHKLDELLSQQTKLNDALKATIEERSKEWGIRVDHVEIRSVDLDATMIRAMAQEAEAERGRRARVITASGEYEAAQKLSEAADILAKNPAAITLRTLATLKEIGAEQNSVIIFPVAQETLLPTNSSGLSAAAIAKALADQMGQASPPAQASTRSSAPAAS
ncbi:slipin family protein [Burkholderia cenocepacia]|uniref:slipin family protein n=1 Tax=Burkholderia cenocepacia TaxID=95486 RepID=UPI001B984EA3|nr:slipin family protein [Burkholderia cenocepacia]MBR8030054.1 slipin family protein [Burkholderia cenocepacia]MBR8174242.1 slipin family protein [Burkholderia cenocepacia]